MDTSTVNSLISGAAGLIGSGISAGFGLLGQNYNIDAQREANQTNLQIARENRDFYYEQWQRENQYNDPSAVMQRLSRAGLNPNLMYGEGTGGLAASATMQNVDPGRVAAPTVDPYLMSQIGLMTAQTKKTNADTEKTISDIDVNRGIIKVNESVCLYNAALTSFTKAQQDKVIGETQMLGTLTEEINSKIALNYATIRNMSAQQFFKSVELALQSKELDGKLELWSSQTGLNKEQLKYVGVLAMAKVRNLDADTLLKGAQIDLVDAQRRQCESIIDNLSVENDQLNWNLQQHKKYDDVMMDLQQASIVSKMVDQLFGDTAQSAANSVLKIDTFNKYNQKHRIGFE